MPERVADVEAEGDQDLIVAAPAGVHLLAGVAEALDEVGLDGGVPVLEALVEHEAARGERAGEIGERGVEGVGLGGGEHAGAREAVDVGPRGAHVGEEEAAIEHHVVAGAKALDTGVDRGACLVPDHAGHGSIPEALREAERQVEVLHGLAGRALEEVVERGDDHRVRLPGLAAKPPIVACGRPAASRTSGDLAGDADQGLVAVGRRVEAPEMAAGDGLREGERDRHGDAAEERGHVGHEEHRAGVVRDLALVEVAGEW